MPIAFVRQATGVGSNATTCSVTITAPSAGNALVVCFATNSNATPTGITGGGVTWAILREEDQASGVRNANIWYGLNSSGAAGPVVITFAAKSHCAANVSEWSGLTATDLTAGTAGTSVTIDAGAVAATINDSLVIASANNGTGGIAPSAGPTNSFNALTYVNGGDDNDLLCAYLITTAAGNYSTAWTVASVAWAAVIATFKGTADIANPYVSINFKTPGRHAPFKPGVVKRLRN